ncbi:helix-turn-helix domain-containing protein [Nocardia sp. NPDC058176]|uniref:helix-turn-helix domain-containing protein n=1 Tax=Nocardia sp. NPDC058176 TaxID=3346368 RepID=UPI0036D7CF03
MREPADSGASPPTWRVIAVMELLARLDKGLTVSQIAQRLSVPRATIASITRELHAARWVQRDERLRYRIGPAALELGAGRTGDEITRAAEPILTRLARDTGCGATLSRIAPGTLTVVAKRYPETGRVIPGFSLGQPIPLGYPAGAAVMPWRERAEQDAWMATAQTAGRQGRQLIRFVAEHGFAMFRPGDGNGHLVEVLVDLLTASGSAGVERSARETALRQIARLTSHPCTITEITDTPALPVSYLSAPIVRDGRAEYELQLGILAAATEPAQRRRYIQLVRSCADQLAEMLADQPHARRDPGMSTPP